MTRLLRLGIPALIVLALVVVALTQLVGGGSRTLVAEFPRTVSIYEGSEVRVLGVTVGSVDKVEPGGTSVKVTMSYDDDVKIPADAKALIVAPSVVGDRFVQLTPAYTSGPTLRDGAVLDVDRTATPLELDDIYGQLDKLVVAVGPEGANKNGALSDLLDQTAKNFGGEGAQFHETIGDFSDLTQTLDNNKDKLFGSAQQLEGFINTLAKNDDTVRNFNTSIASVSDLLAGERNDLASSLRNLASALGDVQTFVKENKDVLHSDIHSLNQLSKVVVKRRDQLSETLDNAPLALDNLFHAYNPQSGTLDTNSNLDKALPFDLANPTVALCTILDNLDSSGKLCKQLGGAGRAGDVFGAAAGTGSSYGKKSDPTLGGLVPQTEVTR
ncbi:MCE family protein [Nocardioides sp. Kera G14]|uniref:MCE family protein n=1 Tax=Nocardioides sp. Kera G14 TaxID=2884264 RepID=UPI001D10AFE2|nr:MCE family protein [Nocardioides sp. Kera G14]UDY23973.1 MCE family protein [Nocardioides sp. Kera G14]